MNKPLSLLPAAALLGALVAPHSLQAQSRQEQMWSSYDPTEINGARGGRRLPTVVTGNPFPGGTAYVFQYDVDNAREQRQDDLVKIWFPNEATPFIDPEMRTVDVAAVYAWSGLRATASQRP